jgi:hypothetical protein
MLTAQVVTEGPTTCLSTQPHGCPQLDLIAPHVLLVFATFPTHTRSDSHDKLATWSASNSTMSTYICDCNYRLMAIPGIHSKQTMPSWKEIVAQRGAILDTNVRV